MIQSVMNFYCGRRQHWQQRLLTSLKSLMTFFKKHDIAWTKVDSVCTDGAPSMQGHRSGFVALVKTSDGTSTWNRDWKSKILELFLLSESENFNQFSDSENDSLEFVCLQLKLQSKNIGT